MFPLNLYARVRISLCTLHTRPRVQRAPGLPRALCIYEGKRNTKLRAHRAARMRSRIQFVGWVERSDTHRLTGSVDGYRFAPPILQLDCVATLAMTAG